MSPYCAACGKWKHAPDCAKNKECKLMEAFKNGHL